MTDTIMTAGEAAAVLGLTKTTLSLYARGWQTGESQSSWPVHVGKGQGVWIAPLSVWRLLAEANAGTKGRPRKGVEQ